MHKSSHMALARILMAIAGLLFCSCTQRDQGLKLVPVSSRPLAQRPAWTKDGGLVMDSSMEPLMFFLRRGGAPADIEKTWANYLTEDVAKKLKEEGINFILVNLHKGFGLKAERNDIDAVRNFTEVAHRYGLRVAGYVGSTMMYETFFAEEPEARDWEQIDQFGHPIYYPFGQSYRIAACRNNPGYQAFIQKVLRLGIQELKLDAIFFDQLQWWSEPYACRDKYCQAEFRNFLRRRYNNQQLKSRLGFNRLDDVIPQPYGIETMPGLPTQLLDPLMQDWVQFRCASLSDRFGEYVNYIHQLNPEAAVWGDPMETGWDNHGFLFGVDPERLYAHGDFVWSEEGPPKWTEDSRLVSKIRSYKETRAMGKSLVSWERVDLEGDAPPTGYDFSEELSLAEAMAYNDNNLGFVTGRDMGGTTLPQETQRYINFFHAHQEVLRRTMPVADVAVLRTFASNEFNPSECLYSTILFEQTLIQSKIPWAIIFDHQLNDLSKYKVLVLADQDALSDGQISDIRRFVQKGGGLVATGNSSLMTESRRPRASFGLADLFGIDRPPTRNGAPLRRSVGKGRVAYIPSIEPATSPPPAQLSYSVDTKYWKLPKNYQALVAAVEWAENEQPSAVVQAPLSMTMELAEQVSTHTLLLHLINYDTRKPVSDIPVQIRIPEGWKVRQATLESPDGGGLSYGLQVAPGKGGYVSLRVPRLGTYDLVLLRLEK